MTSSARARIAGGISTPSARATFRLITSSNLVGCRAGVSAGEAPLSILVGEVDEAGRVFEDSPGKAFPET